MRSSAALAAGVMFFASACSLLQRPAPEEPPAEAAPAPEVQAPKVTVPAPKPDRTSPAARLAELEMLMQEFQRLRRLPQAELIREQEAARLAFVQASNDAARVRLAIALTVPGASPADEQRGLELLDPLVKNPMATLHALAFLMSSHVVEQRRLVTQMQGLQQNNQGLQQNVQALQQNVQALQQKLDALRTLERSLSERREPVPKRR